MQQARAGIERRLRQLDGADVVLRDLQLRLRRRRSRWKKVRPSAWTRGLFAAMPPSITPSCVEDAGQEHFRQRLDDARAADAGDAERPSVCLGEVRMVRPEIGADHLEARLQRVADRCARARWPRAPRAGRRRSARLRRPDRSATRRRAGGAGCPARFPHWCRHRRSSVISSTSCGRLGQDDARGVGADMAGDAGQHIDARIGMDLEVDFGGPDLHRPVGRQCKRRTAELDQD